MISSRCFAGVLLLILAGCATSPKENLVDAIEVEAETTLQAPIPGWRHQTFPGKRASQYRAATENGTLVIAVDANASASMLKRELHIKSDALASANFSWRVSQLLRDADMAQKHGDDSPVRVVLVFEGDRSVFSAKDAMLSELALALTGEELPYATLMYVWSNKRKPETVIVNPRTSRIRKIVVESGPDNLNMWLSYRRNIRSDFEAAFGEPPGALVGVALMTDTDNTQASARAWYGPVTLEAAQ